ncbi:unnamed protein product, partial [Amoebophrya sp. A120]|eukprot:GSA120T00023233001.1
MRAARRDEHSSCTRRPISIVLVARLLVTAVGVQCGLFYYFACRQAAGNSAQIRLDNLGISVVSLFFLPLAAIVVCCSLRKVEAFDVEGNKRIENRPSSCSPPAAHHLNNINMINLPLAPG